MARPDAPRRWNLPLLRFLFWVNEDRLSLDFDFVDCEWAFGEPDGFTGFYLPLPQVLMARQDLPVEHPFVKIHLLVWTDSITRVVAVLDAQQYDARAPGQIEAGH
ncbi:hypothetical protein [Variovorax sp. WS11]|uniref:hypothetical protein n=1 Tax=Variovorax sp. WS11 TaxID=1105204 RepID=UPI001EF1B75E|nr:hypothetical protein [Variovorax sp. WS11]